MSIVVQNLLINVPVTVRASRAARCSVMALGSILVYLLLGQLIRPGFIDYWWYLLFQTSVMLVSVVLLDTAFAPEGGMTWQSHMLVISATLADTIGNACHLYSRWPPYDKLVHFASGATVAAIAYQVQRNLQARGWVTLSELRLAAISVVASLLLAGLAWETYEYLSDAVFSSGRVQSGTDTLGDVGADIAGALVAICILTRAQTRRSEA